MPDTLLRASAAARRMGLPTKQLLWLMRTGEVPYVMHEGIAHVPEAAVSAHAESRDHDPDPGSTT